MPVCIEDAGWRSAPMTAQSSVCAGVGKPGSSLDGALGCQEEIATGKAIATPKTTRGSAGEQLQAPSASLLLLQLREFGLSRSSSRRATPRRALHKSDGGNWRKKRAVRVGLSTRVREQRGRHVGTGPSWGGAAGASGSSPAIVPPPAAPRPLVRPLLFRGSFSRFLLRAMPPAVHSRCAPARRLRARDARSGLASSPRVIRSSRPACCWNTARPRSAA